MSRLASAFRAVRGLIFVGFFVMSLIFNITLLASNFVFGVASSAFSALTGTRSLVVSLVLSRFSSGLFRAMFAMKEIENGKEIHRRVSA